MERGRLLEYGAQEVWRTLRKTARGTDAGGSLAMYVILWAAPAVVPDLKLSTGTIALYLALALLTLPAAVDCLPAVLLRVRSAPPAVGLSAAAAFAAIVGKSLSIGQSLSIGEITSPALSSPTHAKIYGMYAHRVSECGE